MNNLQQALRMAERDATRTGKSHVIINLNPFGKLYVVRELSTNMEGVVSVVPPGRDLQEDVQ
jgi:hypothetical protein